jgi:hypothetical protein
MEGVAGMKGIIFTEFLDFIEARAGYETVDAILEAAQPASGGAYTAVGNYEFKELSDLLALLSGRLEKPIPNILRSFGHHLFRRYVVIYPGFFRDYYDPLDFLETIEHRIHTEVLKLYPDARLPRLKTERIGPGDMLLHYRSRRPLGELCIGVIEACGEHFAARLDIRWESVPDGLDITIHNTGPTSAVEAAEAGALQ